MSACLLVSGKALALAAPLFTLGWTHSVEKVEWEETWRVAGTTLVLEQARVKASGAGMEPPPEARRVEGWYVWHPQRIESRLMLAASGATGSGWRLCSGGQCHVLGENAAGPVQIEPCPPFIRP